MAYIAREMQCECVCVVPHGAPRTKLDAVERLGGRLISVPYEEWWATLEQGTDSAVAKAHRLTGLFVHPVADPHVVAGNASVGMEIFEDLDHVDEVARAPPRARARALQTLRFADRHYVRPRSMFHTVVGRSQQVWRQQPR